MWKTGWVRGGKLLLTYLLESTTLSLLFKKWWWVSPPRHKQTDRLSKNQNFSTNKFQLWWSQSTGRSACPRQLAVVQANEWQTHSGLASSHFASVRRRKIRKQAQRKYLNPSPTSLSRSNINMMVPWRLNALNHVGCSFPWHKLHFWVTYNQQVQAPDSVSQRITLLLPGCPGDCLFLTGLM